MKIIIQRTLFLNNNNVVCTIKFITLNKIVFECRKETSNYIRYDQSEKFSFNYMGSDIIELI
jgi:hypothetical protein